VPYHRQRVSPEVEADMIAKMQSCVSHEYWIAMFVVDSKSEGEARWMEQVVDSVDNVDWVVMDNNKNLGRKQRSIRVVVRVDVAVGDKHNMGPLAVVVREDCNRIVELLGLA